MDADTTAKKGGHEAILEAFANREADILIGTQMIVKGHDFPACQTDALRFSSAAVLLPSRSDCLKDRFPA